MLTLAGSEQRITDGTPVDLADIARHVTDEARNAAEAVRVNIGIDLQSAVVTGDPVLLERLTHNLVDNATRHNVSDHGEVNVSTRVIDGVAVLTVGNTGPPVPPYEVPSLFEPFRRSGDGERLAGSTATEAGSGAGLGLSIVRSVAHAHGGDVQASPRPGGGLTVLVRVPAAPEVPHAATTPHA